MALEALGKVSDLGGYEIVIMDELRAKYPERFGKTGAMDHEWFERSIRPHYHVYVRRDKNSISFTLQNGPIREAGVNGCQVDTLIWAALEILKGLNAKHPCRQNSLAITKLEEAIHWLEDRTRERLKRAVEGTSQP